MTLTPRPHLTATHIIAPGYEVTIRSLTVGEGRTLKAITDAAVADARAISWATDSPYDEALLFVKDSPGGDVIRLVQAIFNLSGLGAEAQFPGGSGDDAGAERATE